MQKAIQILAMLPLIGGVLAYPVDSHQSSMRQGSLEESISPHGTVGSLPLSSNRPHYQAVGQWSGSERLPLKTTPLVQRSSSLKLKPPPSIANWFPDESEEEADNGDRDYSSCPAMPLATSSHIASTSRAMEHLHTPRQEEPVVVSTSRLAPQPFEDDFRPSSSSIASLYPPDSYWNVTPEEISRVVKNQRDALYLQIARARRKKEPTGHLKARLDTLPPACVPNRVYMPSQWHCLPKKEVKRWQTGLELTMRKLGRSAEAMRQAGKPIHLTRQDIRSEVRRHRKNLTERIRKLKSRGFSETESPLSEILGEREQLPKLSCKDKPTYLPEELDRLPSHLRLLWQKIHRQAERHVRREAVRRIAQSAEEVEEYSAGEAEDVSGDEEV